MDWIASLLTMLGVYLLGKKIIWGWVSSWVGSVIWSVYAIVTDQWPLLLLNVVFVGLDTKGFLNWRREA